MRIETETPSFSKGERDGHPSRPEGTQSIVDEVDPSQNDAVLGRSSIEKSTVFERSLGFRESLGNRSATCETRPKHDGMAARAAVLCACLAAVACAETVVQPPTVGLDLDLHVERGNEGVRRDGRTKERKDPKEWANGRQLAQKNAYEPSREKNKLEADHIS